MKKFYKSIALAILAAAILLTQTRCQKENTDNSPNGPTVEQLEDDHPGLSIDCEDGGKFGDHIIAIYGIHHIHPWVAKPLRHSPGVKAIL